MPSEYRPIRTEEDWLRYDMTPRLNPLPAPSVGIFDLPYKVLVINAEWYSHVIGMIVATLTQDDAWVEADTEAAVQEIYKMLVGVDICQIIADCINDLESPTRQALIEALANVGNPVLPPHIVIVTPETVVGNNNVSTENLLPGCDLNNVYGLCEQVVNLSHQLIFDALQITAVALNYIEALAILADDVPILGNSVEMVKFLVDSGAELYGAGFTEAKKTALTCELFCTAKDTCSLSLADIGDFFMSLANAPDYPNPLETILAEMILLGSGEAVVDALFSLLWASILDGIPWLGINNVQQVERYVASFYNDPNPDWEILCEDCSEEDELPACIEWNNLSGSNWTITFEYITATIEENAVVDNTFGNGAPSAKAGFIDNGTNRGRYVNVRVTFDEPMRVQSASMQYWYQDDGNDSPRRRISLFDAEGVALANQQLDTSGAPKGEWVNHEWTGDVSGVWYIEFNFRHWGTDTGIFNVAETSAWIDNVCMEVEPVSDDFTPIVAWTNAFCEDGFGTSITDLGDGYWQISSQTNPKNGSALGVSFKDVYGRAFVVDEIEFSSSTGIYYGGSTEAVSCRQETYNWFTSLPEHLLTCDFQRSTGLGSFSVTFRAVLA